MRVPAGGGAGWVQVWARCQYTGLQQSEVLWWVRNRVLSGIGTAPLPTLAKNDLRAIGRTNDCILYGGQTSFVIDATDEELADLAVRLPASSSADYGTPFYETFKKYDGDFYKIDKLLFSPAEVRLTSATSGQTSHGGLMNPEVVRRALRDEGGRGGQPGGTGTAARAPHRRRARMSNGGVGSTPTTLRARPANRGR